jgi:hypothetical protein
MGVRKEKTFRVRYAYAQTFGAEMPSTEDLPETLRPLTRRNGIEVRPYPDFHNDVTRLIKRLG